MPSTRGLLQSHRELHDTKPHGCPHRQLCGQPCVQAACDFVACGFVASVCVDGVQSCMRLCRAVRLCSKRVYGQAFTLIAVSLLNVRKQLIVQECLRISLNETHACVGLTFVMDFREPISVFCLGTALGSSSKAPSPTNIPSQILELPVSRAGL